MNSTVFTSSSVGFSLTVDTSKAVATTAWLASKDCDFIRYINAKTTRYVFNSIATTVVEAIARKHPVQIESIEDMNLQQLFATADLIGNKYQDDEFIFVTQDVMTEYSNICRRFNEDDGGLNQEDSDFLDAHKLSLAYEQHDILRVI